MFREWIGEVNIQEETWKDLIEEDESFDYESKSVGREVTAEIEKSSPLLMVLPMMQVLQTRLRR